MQDKVLQNLKKKQSASPGETADEISDRLYPSEISNGLNTKIFGRKIYYFDSLSSTMDTALSLARRKAPEGTIVVSEHQKAGRGRLGRSWVSPKYKGLYVSVILNPKIDSSLMALITLTSAVSVREAVYRSCGLDCQIKWPNDIIHDNHKIGGILTESYTDRAGVVTLIIGLGLNVNGHKKDLVDTASTISHYVRAAVDRIALLQEVLRQLEHNYTMFIKGNIRPVLDAWRRHSSILGERVIIDMHKGRIEGVAVDIDADGGLLIRSDTGFIDKIMTGDVIRCR